MNEEIKYPISKPLLFEEERDYLIEAFNSSWISSKGKYISKFESEFAEYIGTQYGVAVSNGTTALHLALEVLNIGEGDEVIVPDLTFAATINAVLHAGAIPVIVDVNLEDWCISVEAIKEAITDKTKAIIPVHIYGQPCDMKGIMDLAIKNNLYVIEDCAEAHGAIFENAKVGTFGHVSCFSFFANKIITTGEGGICLTNDEGIAGRLRILRDHGMDPNKKYSHEVVGYNYRMTNLQAAIGLGQLHKINQFLLKRHEIENKYIEYLNSSKYIQIQKKSKGKVCWLVSILLNGVDKIELIELLKKKGIEIRSFFIPLSQMSIYKGFCKSSKNSLIISESGINLPTYIDISNEAIEYISNSILKIVNEIGEKN